MKWKQAFSVAGISAATAVLSVVGYNKITGGSNSNTSAPGQYSGKLPANYANYTDNLPDNAIDFTAASQAVIPAVVHIKTKIKQKTAKPTSQTQRNPFFDDPFFDQFQDFFGQGSPYQRIIPEQRASGSGVLISGDGYILTNNHVIEGADEVTVTLSNKKSYKAKVVGSDVASDLGVIKIDGNDFPSLIYGNSDDVRIGQWVLAVGYPLALDCSVTAGIVSAKARSLGLNQEKLGNNKSAIESYIQTDAAVNKGNSGGALVNARGELIGINAAIASPTGYYAGYSYAIPINIAKKIANDIIKHGTAQRAYLGIRPAIGKDIEGMDELKDGKGVEISGAAPGGAAAAAGLKSGDVITKINGRDVQTWNELVEQVASYSVGDKIDITFIRNGRENVVPATLKNEAGNFDVITQQTLAQELGADFENLDAKKAQEYGIDGGVVVKNLSAKGLLKTQNPSMKAGLVIIRVNGVEVNTIDELSAAISAKSSTIIQGFYPGSEGIYNYALNKNADND